ncbi:AraC family transcriptional regulator [Occultella glacieicola]|uniref:AraC family transcriptional regulator n=1 Tax=Occultella glacieicola TaxID=2518684 RepID=A0ABY2E630_9MICO|nr:AraC family transcriptional regulator [Occultella glacieicola]TDE94975.1 AraC family transcriptional regulator [Occultella glacieicola]
MRRLDFREKHPTGGWRVYPAAEPVLRDNGLSCRGAGEQHGALRHTSERRLATHGLVLVTEGRGRYVDDAHPAGIEVVAPAVIWLFPGVRHGYGPDGGGWREHWVLFEGVATRALESFGAWERTEPVCAAAPELAERVAPVFAHLRRVLAVPGGRGAMLAAGLSQHLIAVVAECAPAAPTWQPPGVLESLTATALVQMPVEHRARALGLTEAQLRAAVLGATGLTPHAFVLATRLERAQSLLARTAAGVAEVARQVGYDDPAYFSRLFHRRVGMSPSAFREQESRRAHPPRP